jgi:hypothetical protein
LSIVANDCKSRCDSQTLFAVPRCPSHVFNPSEPKFEKVETEYGKF